MRIEWSG